MAPGRWNFGAPSSVETSKSEKAAGGQTVGPTRSLGDCMKPNLLVIAGAILFSAAAYGAEKRPETKDARTGAPYFVVDEQRGSTEALPLASTRSDVRVAGTIAHVRVTQVYQNRGADPIEATYIFPGSTRSAVFAMRMKIADRTIEAKIKTRADARKTYDKAKAAGKSASLLEQERPNVFRMKVANIMPGDRIEVVLDYVEMLVPDAGVYELVIPAVVGPRYAGEQGPGRSSPKEAWVENPYLTSGPSGSPYTWGVGVQIDAGMPIAGLTSPSHKISPRFDGPSTAGMETNDEKGGDRDFVLRYRLTQDQIQSGVLLYPGEQENFFAVMMQPPRRPAANQIPPREYIFVVDVSGSMRGFPLEVSKTLMRNLLSKLKRHDRFNLLFFAGGSRVLSPESLPATEDNIQRAVELLTQVRGGGGTQLLPALERALAMPRSGEMSTSIVVITDGYINVERQAFDIVRKRLNEANLFAFGIGRSVNRYLVEGLARAGMGEPFVVLQSADAAKTADRFAKYIEAPVLTNIGVQFDGFQAYDVEPSTMPDLFAERPVLLFGKYRGAPKGSIIVEGRNAQGRFKQRLDLKSATRDRNLVALKYLWARHRLADLADYGRIARDASVVEEITKLGLKYNLMTDHTSFVAVDNVVRNGAKNSTSVVQPLPVPQGVDRGAVGGAMRTYSVKGYGSGGGGLAAYSLAPQLQVRRKRPAGRARPAPPMASAEPAPEAKAAKPVDALMRALKRSKRALRKCFDRHAPDLRTVQARYVLHFRAIGRVQKVAWSKSTGREKLDACLARVLRRIRVPARTTDFRIARPLAFER